MYITDILGLFSSTNLSNALSFVLGVVATVVIGIVLQVVLGDDIKLRLSKWMKKFVQGRKNPSYKIGITSQLRLKRHVDFETVLKEHLQIFTDYRPKKGVHEVSFVCPNTYDIQVRIQLNSETKTIQPDEHVNESEEVEEVDSFFVTVSSKVKYKDAREHIEDLRDQIENVENELRKSKLFDLYRAASTLYVEIENLERFLYVLDSLQANQINGTIKGSEIKFSYHDKRITVDDKIGSTAISWLQDAIAYLG